MSKLLRFILASGLSVLLALTTACAQLPTGGEIKTGPNVESGLETDYLYYSPSGPAEGATQEDILLGFMNAGTGPQNDYAVARTYLAKDFNSIWKPNSEVLVQDGKPIITLSDNDSATVVVPISATINERGQYQAVPVGTTRSIQITFEEEAGNWRINSAPNLTMVIRPVFDVVFKAYAVYFFDNQQKHLVPDVRWFPSRASTSTRLVNALLGGPSEWLQPAVRTSIPSGTRLTLSSVTVADGVASVDLSSRALRASAINRKLMQVQIRETLLQLSSVYSVQVTIERGVLESANWGYSTSQIQISTPVALLSDELVHLGVSQTSPLEMGKELVDKVAATNFGLNVDEKLLALSSPTGVYLSYLNRPSEEPILLTSGNEYLAPIVDIDGYTWVVPKDGQRALMVFDAEGRRVSFLSGWLSGSQRLSVSISSEGSRLLVVSGTRGKSRVQVASIVRSENGDPVSLGTPFEPISTSNVYSATWLDNIRIGLLETQITQYVQPIVTMIGGDSRSLPTFTTGSIIVGSGQASLIYILDSYGVMYQFRGSSWAKVRDGVKALRFPAN